jgi:hypothetical protein
MEKNDIDALIAARTREGRTIEYKENLVDLETESGKKEFLRDVASFANTAGGTIYYGIKERRDAKGKKTAEPEVALGVAGFNNEIENRINDILATGIEPRLRSSTEVIEGFPKGPILALSIHRSLTGPHMTRDGRFFSRDNTGKKPMDYHMIRSSFVALQEPQEAVRAFHRGRIDSISQMLLYASHSILAIHCIPVSAFIPSTATNIAHEMLAQYARGIRFLQALDWRTNLEGFLFYHRAAIAGEAEHAQVFRNGILERVIGGLTGVTNGEHVAYGREIGDTIDQTVRGFLSLQRDLGLDAPISVMVLLKGVMGHKLVHPQVGHPMLYRGWLHFDRDELWFPEMTCTDLHQPFEPIVKEILKLLWQAAGFNEAPAL